MKWLELLETDYLEDYVSKSVQALALKPASLRHQLTRIDKAFEDEQLTIVLGAGSSIDYGLPGWETLLQKLLLDSFPQSKGDVPGKSAVLAKLFTKVFSPNPLIAARYLRQHFKASKLKNAFERAVRDALYETLDKNFKSNLFSELVQLCIAPGKTPNLDSVITYNYDDILENHLDSINVEIPYNSISSVGVHAKPGELPIYHVHGFLPRKGKLGETNLITLSEDVYHQQYGDTYSWNNLVQINKFRDKVCLFIGLSLTDPNLRRLIDIANTQRGEKDTRHFIIRKRHRKETIKQQLEVLLKNNPDILSEKSRANLKLDEAIVNLVKVMETFETQDDRSFGIDTIWVSDYSDIAVILKAIRERTKTANLQTPNN
jgi:hypothetical protein